MFAAFIASTGETRSAWAARLGISKSFLSDLVNGNRIPSLELAVRIERATAGRVPAASWIPDAPPAASPAPAPEEDAA